MKDRQVFLPPKNPGLLLHIILSLVLTAGIVFLMIRIFSQTAGWSLVLYLLSALALIALLPFLAYRA